MLFLYHLVATLKLTAEEGKEQVPMYTGEWRGKVRVSHASQ